jgi:hypothetical protein
MLNDRGIDAFATNKGILFQLADGLPGARVLDGRWGTESLAIAVPKGREPGKEWLARFAVSVREQGLVGKAAERAGLRGLAAPEARGCDAVQTAVSNLGAGPASARNSHSSRWKWCTPRSFDGE